MTTETEIRRPAWRDPIVAAAMTILLIVQAVVIWRALPRALDHDEGEHLRAAAWMASGRTLYRDFAENHTPFLYLILAPLAPAPNSDIPATRHYVMIARALSAAAGIAAVILIAACASQAAGDSFAMLPVLAALLASSWTWLRGVADVRSEPWTLLLFWAGAFLVVHAESKSRRAILAAGAGIGLIAVADLWNPKWPLESLVILGWYLVVVFRSCRASASDAAVGRGGPYARAAASFAIACAIPLLSLAVALRVTTLRDLLFFSFTYASSVSHWYRSAAIAAAEFGKSATGFAFAPSWLMPWVTLAGISILLISRQYRQKLVLLVFLLVAAAAAEVVVIYPYPYLWPQYLVMWACVVSLLGGVAIATIARNRIVRAAIASVIVVFFITHEWTHVTRSVDEKHWQTMSALQRRLGPGEAAWVRAEALPTAAPAGSYYWYAFADQVPFSLAYGQTAAARGFLPPLRDEDLPPCRILAGNDTMHVRLMDSRAVRNLLASKRCMSELARRGSLRRIDGTPIWEVIR